VASTTEFDGVALQKVSAEMQDAHAVCNSIQNEIDQAKSFLGANWFGESHNGYGNSLTVWAEDFAQVQAALAQMDAALMQAGKGSVNVEGDNTNLASSALSGYTTTPSWT
jgi:uncharacterized protein YukE